MGALMEMSDTELAAAKSTDDTVAPDGATTAEAALREATHREAAEAALRAQAYAAPVPAASPDDMAAVLASLQQVQRSLEGAPRACPRAPPPGASTGACTSTSASTSTSRSRSAHARKRARAPSHADATLVLQLRVFALQQPSADRVCASAPRARSRYKCAGRNAHAAGRNARGPARTCRARGGHGPRRAAAAARPQVIGTGASCTLSDDMNARESFFF